jgi:hypothetical protein
MNNHRYILEPYNGLNTRYHCPSCKQKNKTFVRYIDTETGEQLPPQVGRCNSEVFCGYHYTPKQYFQDNNITIDQNQHLFNPRSKPIKPKSKPHSYIPLETLKASLKNYELNHFIQYLTVLFGKEITEELISRYFIGSSKHWLGSVVFWQIDDSGKVRTGKIMLYDPTTGKRVKEPYNHITWVHKLIQLPDFELKQCFFGEHLLTDKSKLVAIVESEKTALIASVYLPQFIWLAVGSLTNLNADKCQVLKGRNITLFPDLNGFDKWSDKAFELSPLGKFMVSDFLELNATETEKNKGLDLADYLIRFNHNKFSLLQPDPIVTKPALKIQPLHEINPIKSPVSDFFFDFPETPQHENWIPLINELETFFSGITLPAHPVKLNHYTTIIDVSKFLQSHFELVKFNNGNPAFRPCLNRLQELKNILSKL